MLIIPSQGCYSIMWAKRTLLIIILPIFFSLGCNSVKAIPNNSNDALMNIVVLPDTQVLSRNSSGAAVFNNQMQYAINSNADYVIHLGDIVDYWTHEDEWIIADTAFKILDSAKLPYGVCAGNHDINQKTPECDAPTYWENFPVSRVSGNGVYQGQFKTELDNHYDIISKHGLDLLVIYASYNITDSEYTWVEQTINSYPDHWVIMITHEFIWHNGWYQDKLTEWNDIGKRSSNVFLQFSGHAYGVGYVDSVPRHALLNYQFLPLEEHYIGILTLKEDTIEMISYNPTTDDYIWSNDHSNDVWGEYYDSSAEKWSFASPWNITYEPTETETPDNQDNGDSTSQQIVAVSNRPLWEKTFLNIPLWAWGILIVIAIALLILLL